MPDATRQSPQLLNRSLTQVGAVLLLVLVAVHYLEPLVRVLLVLYAAIALAVVLNAITARIPVRRVWAAALLGLAIFGALGVAIWLLGSLVMSQARSLVENLPAIQAQVDSWIQRLTESTGIPFDDLMSRIQEEAAGWISGGDVVAGARGAADIIVLPLIIVFGGLFAVARPREGLFAPMLRFVPARHRDATERAATVLAERLVGWIQGQLLAMLAVGVLATIAFLIIGVPYAVLLGVLSGLADFIPIAGPWIGAIPAVTIAAVDDPMKGVWTALAITVIQQIESGIVTPLAMQKSVRVHPFITLFALFLFGSLFGFLGILLAVPLVLLIGTAAEILWIERREAREEVAAEAA